MKQETLEEVAEEVYISHKNNDLLYGHSEELQLAYKAGVVDGAKWQQEQIGKSEFLQKLRATLSDAEARRLIFETFKNK